MCLTRTSTRSELNTETHRQLKGVHTLTMAERHPRANPGNIRAELTQEDREPATSVAFVYTRNSFEASSSS